MAAGVHTNTGTVEQVVEKGQRTALKIDGEWYSTFEEVAVSVGDRVSFEFTTVRKDGRTYQNLTAIQPLTETEGDEEATALSEPERIARAVALKAAVELCGPETETEEVLATAEALLGFLLAQEGGRQEGEP
jgi:hypothetical protein